MVKMLTVLVSTISNSQVFLQKNVSSFCKSYSHFFSKNISVYGIFNDQSLNDTLTYDIFSFEQLGPDLKASKANVYTFKGDKCDLKVYASFLDGIYPPLRNHAYSNVLKILQPKKENFQIKKSDIFHISTQNIDRGYSLEPPRRGGSNEYPQSMLFSKIRKEIYTPVNSSFTI